MQHSGIFWKALGLEHSIQKPRQVKDLGTVCRNAESKYNEINCLLLSALLSHRGSGQNEKEQVPPEENKQ